MRLIASAFVTVDGVMEAPGFDEHRDGQNAWALRIQDEETLKWNSTWSRSASSTPRSRRT